MRTARDRKLLRRYAAGRDAEALWEIMRCQQDMVYGACVSILGDGPASEDAAQECFFRLARQADSIRLPLADWLGEEAVRVSHELLAAGRSRVGDSADVAAGSCVGGRRAPARLICGLGRLALAGIGPARRPLAAGSAARWGPAERVAAALGALLTPAVARKSVGP